MKTLNELLSEIEKRASEATELEFYAHSGLKNGALDSPEVDFLISSDSENISADNAFYNHARTDVPALLAVIRKLIEQRDEFAREAYYGDQFDSAMMPYNSELAQILAGEKV